ncbi:unnamed protein product [Adineta steineri]|uniref:Uncharacterized protein n=1 Tax=Adineta steineri TaxID=433720 RepID=A0A814HJI3_9BILA|nr:unnamed protein product [Adineta steineri]
MEHVQVSTPCTSSINCNSASGGGTCQPIGGGSVGYTCIGCNTGVNVTGGACPAPGLCSAVCCAAAYPAPYCIACFDSNNGGALAYCVYYSSYAFTYPASTTCRGYGLLTVSDGSIPGATGSATCPGGVYTGYTALPSS